MVVSSVTAVVTFMALMTVTFALSETTTQAPPSLDIGLESKRLLSLTRKLAVEAKEGISLDLLKMNVLNLQTIASSLLGQIPDQISECQTQAVIKMAAAGIGSHEVLGLLLAEDPIAVLSRRLALSLAFLEQLAQQLENELTLSRDVGSYLAGLVFGTNASMFIIHNSDQVVTDTYTRMKDNDVTVEKGVALGTGFSSGQNGAHWKNTIGSHYFQITPAHSRAARQASLAPRSEDVRTSSTSYSDIGRTYDYPGRSQGCRCTSFSTIGRTYGNPGRRGGRSLGCICTRYPVIGRTYNGSGRRGGRNLGCRCTSYPDIGRTYNNPDRTGSYIADRTSNYVASRTGSYVSSRTGSYRTEQLSQNRTVITN